MLLPSKELLSEVLGRDVDKVKGIEENTLIYGCVHSDGWYDEINIYEFAHKCKECAISKGYHIESMLYDENVDRKYTSGLAKVLFSDANSNYNEVFSCDESSEPEAIFKACEWIMEQTK